MGVCGGYQMLGKAIHDPLAIEGEAGSSEGLAYIDMETTLCLEKELKQVRGFMINHQVDDISQQERINVEAYEIHAGRSYGPGLNKPVFMINDQAEGAWSEGGAVLGSYLHGLFDHPESLAYLLQWAGLKQAEQFDYQAFREQEINRLADCVEEVLPFKKLLTLLQKS